MNDIKKALEAAAKEIRDQGIPGWGNVCDDAAKHIRELKALVESAYREGFLDGYDDDARSQDADAGWEHSDVRKRLEQPR